MRKLFPFIFIISLMAICPRGKAVAASPLTLENLERKTILPLEAFPKGTVLIFLSVDCPISNKYLPELKRLKKEFEAQGIGFFFVFPNADTSVDELKKHAADYELGSGVWRDPAHLAVKAAGAKVTPEAAVFDARQNLIYRGRIDDRFPELGKERGVIVEKNLEQVLKKVVAGEPCPFTQTKAIGCGITRSNL